MKHKILRILYHLATAIWLVAILLPLLTLVIASFKLDDEFYTTSAYSLAKYPSLENYHAALNGSGLIESLISTIIIICLSIIVTTILSSMVAYILERFEFRFKKLIVILFIVVSFIPMAVMQVSVFQVMTNLKLFDTYFGLALLYSVSDIVVIYLFREYISKIPQSIDQSARLSGASYVRIYWQIIFPSLRPAIMIISMYKVITIYNDFYIQSLYLVSNKTISTYMYQFTAPYKMLWPQICATIILLLIPAIIILIIIQLMNQKKFR